MGAGQRFAARVVLVLAVVGCVLGVGRLVTASAPIALGMHHAMAQAAGDPGAGGQHHGQHHGQPQHADHGACCAAAPGVGATLPALAAHLPLDMGTAPDIGPLAGTVAAPEPRPPDLSGLCIRRT